MSDSNARINASCDRNKKIHADSVKAFLEGVACEESPLHKLAGKNHLVRFIAYFSAQPYLREKIAGKESELILV